MAKVNQTTSGDEALCVNYPGFVLFARRIPKPGGFSPPTIVVSCP